MRGADHQTSQLFSYLSPEALVPASHPLRPIRQHVNQALDALSPAFALLYADGGRPSIPPENCSAPCCSRPSSQSAPNAS